jgi:transaldolase
MKLFLDTANIQEIERASKWGVVSGVTTNPSLVSKESGDFKGMIKKICRLIPGPISVEAVGTKADDIIKQGRILSKWSENVVVKVPINEEGLIATNKLSKEGIPVNMTLVFSVNQALLAASAGARYISPFLGRIDDISWDGVQLIKDMTDVFYNYDFECEIISASIRNPLHVIEVARAGSDIATIPFKVLEQMLFHPLTDSGIRKFLHDWEKTSAKIN